MLDPSTTPPGETLKHCCELAASICGFFGGAILSLDALFAVGRARSEKGKNTMLDAVKKAQGEYVDDHGKMFASAYQVQLWFAQKSALWARIGFGLMTIGFLLDLISKW